MQKATASDTSARHLFTADDAIDGNILDDGHDDYDEMDRSITLQHGRGLQIRTTGVRKGKSGQPPERLGRLTGREFSALRDHTSLVMQDLMERKVLDQVHERIHTSQNAHVYYATATATTTGKEIEYAVKIFRNGKSRQLKMRARREYEYLLRASQLRCVAVPVVCEAHVLVMQFKGCYGAPARPVALGLAYESSWQYHYFNHYQQMICSIRNLYQVVGLVHGSIDEGSFMWHDHGRHPSWASFYLTGLGHAIGRDHPLHMKLLKQDLACIETIFTRLGLRQATDTGTGMLPEDAILDYITLKDPSQRVANYCCWAMR